MSPDVLNLQCNAVLLYTGGFDDSRISVRPSLRLLEGWTLGTASTSTSTRGCCGRSRTGVPERDGRRPGRTGGHA
jgi:hypothetical protein